MSYIYFIQGKRDDDPIKIGTAEDPEKRFDQLRHGNPDLRVLGILERGPGMSESALHEQFAYCRHHREWFCPDPSLLFFIGAYATPYQPPDLIKISLAAERLGLSLWDLKALMKDLGMAPVIQTTQSTQLSFDQFATLRTHLGVIDA